MKSYESRVKGEEEGQLTFIKPADQRGGKRTGAGRKSKRGETYVTRIPTAYRASVEALMALLDDVEHTELDKMDIIIKRQ